MGISEDGTGSQKADSGDGLSGETYAVKLFPDLRDGSGPDFIPVHHLVIVKGHEDGHTASDGDQHVGTETGRLAPPGTAVAYYASADHSQYQPEQDDRKCKFIELIQNKTSGFHENFKEKVKCRKTSASILHEINGPYVKYM
jgi:hypothetical protein